jgi:hypothetical protein
MSIFKSIYEQGYSWVEIPDELWERAEFCMYINGMDVG